jgi:hypothetical protein
MQNTINTPVAAYSKNGAILHYSSDLIAFCTLHRISLQQAYISIKAQQPIVVSSISKQPIFLRYCSIDDANQVAINQRRKLRHIAIGSAALVIVGAVALCHSLFSCGILHF